MTSKQRIAILVDADNVEKHHIEFALQGARKEGNVTLRRAFGRLTSIKGHEEALANLSFAAEVALPTANGSKNAADLLMAQYAVRIAERGVIDVIALVSSDSDFSAVAHGISESGVRVIGFGREKASDILKGAFASFTPFPELPPVSDLKATAPKPGTEELNAIEQLIEKYLGNSKEGRVRVQVLGTPFKEAFGEDYLKRFRKKNLSTLLKALTGYRLEGEGVTMMIVRNGSMQTR